MGIVGYKSIAEPGNQIATDLKEALQEQSSLKYLMGRRNGIVKMCDNQKLPVICGQCCFVFRSDGTLNHRLYENAMIILKRTQSS